MSDDRATQYAGFQLALIGVTGHTVSDILCR
ncbi:MULTISPECIES: Ms4533A family Cys-rich leader peptide [unclassified Streptomyces]|jgi:hypothetical protein|nr:Ms4533A family Cys-rich leader peptide [Streptomyces sp. NBC_01262]